MADALRARIESGEWQSGDQMPSARAIAAEYEVSGKTAARAYGLLAAEGLVVVTPSWGTHRT